MSNRININLIKKKIKIEDIYVAEKFPTSKGYKCLTPFKPEKDPSFNVIQGEEGETFACYSTKQSGDVITLYQLINKCELRVAIYNLGKLAGIEMDNIYAQAMAKDEFLILESKLIKEHSFFIKKNISIDALNEYGVGYVADMDALGIPAETMFKYNLSGVKDSIVYLFKNGIGRNVGFSCRPVNTGSNKYITHSPNQVWGMNRLNSQNDKVIMVEGYNDVLGLRSQGIENVICASGVNFTQKIFDELRSHNISKVTIIPDGDLGGRGWIEQIVEKYGTFECYGIEVDYAVLPYEEKTDTRVDPDEYVLTNREFFIDTPVINPISEYFNRQIGSSTDKLKKILDNKLYLKNWQIQLALKDEFNGMVDVGIQRLGLSNKSYENTFLLNVLNDRILLNNARLTFPIEAFNDVDSRKIYNFILENEGVGEETVENHFGKIVGSLDISGHNIYKDRLLDLYNKRKFQQIIDSYKGSIISEHVDINALASDMIHQFAALRQVDDVNSISVGVAIKEAFEDINNDKFDGLDFGDKFSKINIMTKGLMGGKCYWLSGATGNGKTTLACCIVDSVSIKKDHRTLFLSDEMNAKELSLRQLAISSQVPVDDYQSRKAHPTMEQLKPLLDGRIVYDRLPLVEEAEMYLEKQWVVNKGFDLLVWDYFQLTPTEIYAKKEQHQYLPILTKALKRFAMKYEIPIIGIGMLSQNENKKDFAEASGASGAKAINNDADVVMTISRRKDAKNELSEGNTQIFIDKHRYGKDKVLVPVIFKGTTNTIYEV